LLPLLAAGCERLGAVIPVTGESGTTHFVVIGFGIVSVPAPADAPAATAVRLDALGLALSNAPGAAATLGYTSASFVRVPSGAKDVRVEIEQRVGGPLRVTAHRAALGENQDNRGRRAHASD
jgi:hypothetical protein